MEISKEHVLEAVKMMRSYIPEGHGLDLFCSDLAEALNRALAKESEKNQKFNLKAIYQVYPKRPNTRMGEGLSALMTQAKRWSESDYRDCFKAAKNYAEYCRRNIQDEKFIMQFKTWAGSLKNPRWREWIEPQVSAQASTLDIVED